MKNMEKTNVMRLLDKSNISYRGYEYDNSCTDGEKVAILVGKDANMVFKTLVTVDSKNMMFVFCIPVCKKLDLKKAAKAANVKSIQMLLQKDLLKTTGYIHGGCSPIGMKKKYPTFIDSSCKTISTICISAGKVGHQVEIKVQDLIDYTNASVNDLCE